MDNTLYNELRKKIRERVTTSQMRDSFIKTLLAGLEDEVEKQVGIEGKKVCTWGYLKDQGNFVEHEYANSSKGFDFALQIIFHDAKGNVIFEHAVPFTVEDRDDYMIVNCDGDSVTVEDTNFNSDVKRIPALLDKPLREAVYAVEWNPEEM